MQDIDLDYSHLAKALSQAYGVRSLCEMAAVYFASPDMPEPLRRSLIVRQQLVTVQEHLAEALRLAESYKKVNCELIDQLEQKAIARKLYEPVVRWAGRCSAASAAIDRLSGLFWRFEGLGLASEKLLADRELALAMDQADCFHYEDELRHALDIIKSEMKRWSERKPIPWRELDEAIRSELRIFGSVSYESHVDWELAAEFLQAALVLKADNDPVFAAEIWKEAGYTVGEENADLHPQKAKDIQRWLGGGTRRIKAFERGLQFLKPKGRRGYLLTASGKNKAESIERSSTAL